MDNKKLRKISKKELLEILLSQAKRIDELEQELDKTKNKLESKKITIDESGSLAEASLKINDIFNKAQETADQYIYNIKQKSKKIENENKRTCEIEKEKIIKETQAICQKKEKETNDLCKKLKEETEKYCQKKKKEADNYLSSIKEKNTKTVKNKTTVKTKKDTTKNKTTVKTKKDTTKNINNNEAEKIKSEQKENKVVIEKSKKVIKGRPVKTIKRKTK